jgi:hypothetical protein
VAATLALVLSMSGGALAASKYLITSTKQISPKVLKKLKGKAGAPGTPGTPGKEGTTGKEGPGGKEGPAGKEGLPGKNGTGTPLFFKAKEATGPTKIASLDGAEILAECATGVVTHVTLHATAAHGIYHGQYDVGGKGTVVLKDNFAVGENLAMQSNGTENDYEGWFSYVGPTGIITTGTFGDDGGGSNSGQCLVWGNIQSSATGSTGGA